MAAAHQLIKCPSEKDTTKAKTELSNSSYSFGVKDDMQVYAGCVQPYYNTARWCTSFLQTPCDKSTINVIKTVRLTFDLVEMFLRDVPNTYVIHQLRDPRAIVLSRKLAGSLTAPPLALEARLLCEKMISDIKKRRILEKKYPNVFKEIYFEDLVRHPLKKAEHIYSYLNTNLPKEVQDWLRKDMDQPRQSYSSWRYKLRPLEKTQIDQACEELYHLTSYQTSKDMWLPPKTGRVGTGDWIY